MLSLLLLPPQGKDFSDSVPASVWGPCHRRESSVTFSSMRTSHGCTSAQTAPAWVPLIRCSSLGTGWVPHRITSPANKPAPGGLLSPWGHRCCQEPASAWASDMVTASFWHPPAPGAPLLTPSLTLVSARLFLSHILTPVSICCFASFSSPFLPLLPPRCYCCP